MFITPSGNKRIMEAQVNQNPFEGFGNQFGIDDSVSPYQQNIGDTFSNLLNNEGDEQEKEKSKSEGNEDLLQYLFKKLESFGYPPRRLYEFESEFISEKILPDSFREITVVLPDRYYGKQERLSSKDVNSIINEIQSKFNFNFLDGERKDKKLTLNFHSNPKHGKDEEKEEEVMKMQQDDLDDIFGPSNSKTKKTKKKEANTQREMMKESMQKIIQQILSKNSSN